jgi:hypothetical protein
LKWDPEEPPKPFETQITMLLRHPGYPKAPSPCKSNAIHESSSFSTPICRSLEDEPRLEDDQAALTPPQEQVAWLGGAKVFRTWQCC